MKILIVSAFIVLVLFLFQHKSCSQEKYDISIGAAIPEGYNLGFKYNYRTNRRLDFYYGQSVPLERNTKWRSLSINHAFYFGKINPKANEKLWSVNTGFLYGISNGIDARKWNGFLNLYFAREIIIFPKIYIEPKIGSSYLLFYNVSRGYISGYVIRFIPNFGLSLGLKI